MTDKGTMKSFMKGAVLLTAAGLIVKLLSAIYRVPFQNLVGDRGFYIYQQVYPFIGIFTAWTTYGFAVAVSKMLADTEERDRSAVLRIAFGFISAASVLVFLTLFLGAPLLADWMDDRKLAPLLKAGAFAILFMPALSLLKGQFQSDGDMKPVAYSQVAEQAVRVAIILIGTWFVVAGGYSLYAAGQAAMWGAVAGAAAGVILLLYFWTKRIKRPAGHRRFTIWPVVKKMTAISIGVSMSSLLLLFFQLIDSFTVFRLLAENGLERIAAMEQKGIYDRGQPLVQFGLLLASSLALAIVPLIAHTSNKKSGRSATLYVQLSFRIAFLFAAAAAAGLVFVMPWVNEMLFETREGSAALSIFGLQIVWMSLLLVLTAILHGLGKVKVPALLLILGLILKAAGNVLLIPHFGILGAALAGNIGLLTAVAGLLIYFKKTWPVRFAPLRYFGWIGAAILAMGAVVLSWSLAADGYLFDGLPGRFEALCVALPAVGAGAATFLLITAKSRIISEREWYFIPFGRRMASLQLWLNAKRRREKYDE